MLKTKCVNTAIDREEDGLRILVTRFRGRGMRTSRYDVWMPSLGPSEKLLRSYPTKTWAQFGREYKQELFMDGRPHRLTKQDHQESRSEVHLAADKEAGSPWERHADVSLPRRQRVPSVFAARSDSQQSRMTTPSL